LNVSDLDEAIAFYSKLFGTEPAKVQPGYHQALALLRADP
jgi:predicted enzyme related to lactoylglutathione lyase